MSDIISQCHAYNNTPEIEYHIRLYSLVPSPFTRKKRGRVWGIAHVFQASGASSGFGGMKWWNGIQDWNTGMPSH